MEEITAADMQERQMFASNQGDIKMRDPFDDDCLLDDTFFGCQQQHRQWSAMPGDNIHSSASAETCYMQHCHVDIMQPRLWEGASEAPSMAHEEAYTNSMARQLAHVQDNAFQLENHQSINARDDMDNYEANNDLLMQSTSTLPIAGAVGSDPQLVTSSESHREATPTSYRWRSPPQITQQSVHFAGQAQSSHYYYKRSEVPHPYTPFPSLLPPHYHFHRQQPEVEQHHESSDDCETFLPRAPWSFPNAHSESNERSKAFATEEQQMLRTPSISCMPPMVPIASVVSADTQDRHASFSDHTSPPLIAHNHHDHHPAGRIVQTPEGPALLLLAAHMPSQVVRPFLVLHQPRTTASTTPTATKATATTKRRFQRWTDAEDEILRDACSKEPGPPFNWIRIASQYFHNERSPTQCKSRWGKALQPGIYRGKWKLEEDALVVQLRQEGMSFADIAKHVDGRTAEHIRERWISILDPSNHYGPWSKEEVKILFEAQARLGNKWSEIAKLLPGRSEIAVKNRYHNARTAERRKVRRIAVNMMREDCLQRARCPRNVVAPSVVSPSVVSQSEDLASSHATDHADEEDETSL